MHEGQGVESLTEHLASGNLGGGLTSEEIDLLGFSDLLGETARSGRRYTADSLGPFRRLRLTVVGAQQVVLEVLLGVRPLGHMLGIEPHAVGVQKLLVLQVVLHLVVHHTEAERRIGTGQNGHPLIGDGGSRLVEPRVDDDKPAALFLGVIQLKRCVAGLVRRPVVAEMEVQLAFGEAQGIRSLEDAASHEQLHTGPRAQRHRAQVMMYRATLGVQQAHNGIEVFLADITIGGSEDRFRAPIIVGLLHLRGNIVERFVPTDALPLITTAHLAIGGVGAPTLALHGILDARRGGHVADLGAAARAGSALGNLNGVFLLVGTDTQWNAVLHVHPQKAARVLAAAVVHAGPREPLPVALLAGITEILGCAARLRKLLFLCGSAGGKPCQRRGARSGSAPLDEAASSQFITHT